jgi:hypothetical protein
MSIFDDFVQEHLRTPPGMEPGAPPDEPGEWRGQAFQRQLAVVASAPRPIPSGTVAEARERIRAAMNDYLSTPEPGQGQGPALPLLLVRAAPGVGKSFAAAETAERLALEGRRVLYAGPRHAFFQDVLAVAGRPELWYEWLPRQFGDAEKGQPQTCGYTEQIASWLYKGYRAMDFCSGVCGWDFVRRCPYHAQKKVKAPIIFGQHAHVALAHPLSFAAVIGDENPIGAFQHEWTIPARQVAPAGMDPQQPLTPMLHKLAGLAVLNERLSGPELLVRLGGAQEVLEACELFRMDAEALALAPQLHRAEDAARADYFHLPALIGLLVRESRAALQNPEQLDMFTHRVNGRDAKSGNTYPHRVIVSGNGHLILLLRHPVNDQLPPHVIWLDATGDAHLYEAAFGRPVEVVDATPEFRGRVFQVYDRANGKSTLLDEKGSAREEPLRQLKAQIAAIAGRYVRPAVITFQGVVEAVRVVDAGGPTRTTTDAHGLPQPTEGELSSAHFYAARGTNQFQECDAIIIAGTPQAPRTGLERAARMLFFERMAPFQTAWSTAVRAYAYTDPVDGLGRGYPVSGFWGDGDLQAVLWSVREAEIIQAAHRGRPVLRPVDIWLLTNLPLPELPPDRLLSLQELLAAPAGVEVFKWTAVLAFAERRAGEAGFVTAGDLVGEFGLSRNTAAKYLDTLIRELGWQAAAAPSTGGRPARGAALPESTGDFRAVAP